MDDVHDRRSRAGRVRRGRRDPTVPADFPESLYVSATLSLTIGYDDFVPPSPVSRFALLMGAGIGVGLVAVTTTFLFALFGSHQRRDEFSVELHALTGAPLTGAGRLTSAENIRSARRRSPRR